WVPAGEFLMGTDRPQIDELLKNKDAADKVGRMYVNSEGPQHRTRITRPFYLSTTPVTIGQFRQFAVASGYKTDAERDRQVFHNYIDGKWQPTAPGFSWRDYAASDD